MNGPGAEEATMGEELIRRIVIGGILFGADTARKVKKSYAAFLRRLRKEETAQARGSDTEEEREYNE